MHEVHITYTTVINIRCELILLKNIKLHCSYKEKWFVLQIRNSIVAKLQIAVRGKIYVGVAFICIFGSWEYTIS